MLINDLTENEPSVFSVEKIYYRGNYIEEVFPYMRCCKIILRGGSCSYFRTLVICKDLTALSVQLFRAETMFLLKNTSTIMQEIVLNINSIIYKENENEK